MDMQPGYKVSIIIVSYNVSHFLELCLDSVMQATKGIAAEVIVVDNLSTDESCAMVAQQFSSVKLISNKYNAGFSKANNQGIAIARGEYIHFLNPDTILTEDFYVATLAYMDAHPDTGALGPRLIDGRGQYAPDSKKSFPGFWTSVYKVTGLAKLFPRSTRFNKYYAAGIDELETASTDILSGCCLLVRKTAMEEAGGGFDESYFMYCEDVDLCHRIGLLGYKNIYFPQTTVLHYKGESTRKLSYKYMKVFYTAHALFVKKYYPKNLGIIYISALKIVLAIRNFFNWGRHIFSLFKLSLLDAVLLSLTMILTIHVWFSEVVDVPPQQPATIAKTVMTFVLIWISSLFLNGAYDKPFSVFKAARGMVLGSIVVLASYALLPFDWRYSRAVVLISALFGMIAILLARWVLARFNLIKLVPRGKIDYAAAIVASKGAYPATKAQLKNAQYNMEILGRVTPSAIQEEGSLCALPDLPSIQKLYEINEIIYNSRSLTYAAILQSMQDCAPAPFYKIHVGNALVGSNLQKHPAEEFRLNSSYTLDSKSSRRNKRIFDLLAGLLLLLLYPFIYKRVRHPKGLLPNLWQVLKGKKTWIGYPEAYCKSRQLPKLKPAVSWPFPVLENEETKEVHRLQIAEIYATNYSVMDDLRLLWINFKFLGENV